jgi:hypothetical protein
MRRYLGLTAALIVSASGLLGGGSADAAVYTLMGTRQNVNPLNPLGVGACGPGRSTVNIQPGPGSSTGSSNLGDFTSTQSHCITPPLPASFDSGAFTYNFLSGDSLFGTYTGTVSLSDTPGVFNTIENLIVTGGGGLFLNATGTITTTGHLQFINGNGVYSGLLSGQFETPGVPEPTTWALIISGFGLTGVALRRRRSLPTAA